MNEKSDKKGQIKAEKVRCGGDFTKNVTDVNLSSYAF